MIVRKKMGRNEENRRKIQVDPGLKVIHKRLEAWGKEVTDHI
jgi:hypothetical protein